MSNPRISCAYTLQKILEEKVFFSEIKANIAANDLPFVNMSVLTTLRRLNIIKAVLSSCLKKKIPHKHITAYYLLLNAIAEILYMNTDDALVINSTVANIKQTCDKFLGGMANAVLRRISVQKEFFLQKYGNISPLPEEFQNILSGYQPSEIDKISAVFTRKVPLDISVKSNPQFWAEKLGASILPNGSLRLADSARIKEIAGYDDGQWWVQDCAAALAVNVLGNVGTKKVIDLCAAPGGKTAQLAAKGAKVTALDISANRLQKLQQNMYRLGFHNIQTLCADALEYMQHSNETFDAVLLDAPCSATGTLRRHPEVLYNKTLTDVKEQAEIQKKMLDLSRNLLKKGGILIYCVCSIAKAEGEEQIADFIKNNPDFKTLPIDVKEISPYGEWSNNLITADGCIRTLPFYEEKNGGMDAFFICRLQRII